MNVKTILSVLVVIFAMSAKIHAQTGEIILLSENFESGILDSSISISTAGTFTTNPGIFATTALGGAHAFGFGVSTCPANCWMNDVTYMTVTFPGGADVEQLSFNSVELYGNWGSVGYIFLDPAVLPSSANEPDFVTNSFASFDQQTNLSPTSSNTFVIPINRRVTNLVIMVEDITDVSEIFIDDLLVTGSAPSPRQATAAAVLTNSFVVAVNITDGGYGYTNTPLVQFIGGGGSGAQAVAVVSNGTVIAVNIVDAGDGYTNAPIVVIAPPFILNPVLGIAPFSFLTFSNLTVGGIYQLQQLAEGYYWTNLPVSITATNTLYTEMVAGVASGGLYRLALSPVSAQAFAAPNVVNGFVVGATLTSGGSGYVTNPPVSIVGWGTNAGGISQISGGVVTNIVITNAGSGYTNTTTVEIGPPPAAAVSPTVQLVMQLNSASLVPFTNSYQIQFTPALGTPWGNWNGGLFSPTNMSNSQYLFVTNTTGFFRLQYVP